MKKVLLSIVVLFLSVLAASAQEHTIVGRVTSPEDDLGLPGVTVVIKGNIQKGTVTDMNGDYSLSGVKSTDTLVFSYISYLH